MNPITFPARPRQGGPLPLAIEAGTYPHDGFALEPKFNGWRVMVHTPTGHMFNRHGSRLFALEADFITVLGYLQALATPFEWLDCEGLERRHDIAQGSLIVMDWIVREPMSYRHRRAILQLFFPLAYVGTEQAWQKDSLLLMPSHELNQAERLWALLQKANDWLNCIFYEGVVGKSHSSLYPIQLRSSSEECTDWIKHRFTTK